MTVVAAYTIAKNEAKHAERWCETTAGADARLVAVDARSSDDTAAILHEHGVTVLNVDWQAMGGFRFDVARNFALDHLPATVDYCVTVDMDEIISAGFADRVRAAATEAEFGKGFLRYRPGAWGNNADDGYTYPYGRVHHRRGWRWDAPCHEDTFSDGTGPTGLVAFPDVVLEQHEEPPRRPRSNYLPLLRLGVEERPHDARMAVYYARQLHFDGHPASEVVEAVEAALLLGPWPPEAAYLCRVAADVSGDAERWLARSCADYPAEAESWHDLARLYHDRAAWEPCAQAAAAGLGCAAADHYLVDAARRGWRLHDLAAIAAWHLGDRHGALRHGALAAAANPDPRLVANLGHYAA